jgi:hypothetical protein
MIPVLIGQYMTHYWNRAHDRYDSRRPERVTHRCVTDLAKQAYARSRHEVQVRDVHWHALPSFARRLIAPLPWNAISAPAA